MEAGLVSVRSFNNSMSNMWRSACPMATTRGHEICSNLNLVPPFHVESSMNTKNIQKHMLVMSSCGCRIGVVDAVQGNEIKLTKNDPQAAGRHHLIPMEWVARVDDMVHLNKDAADAMREWKAVELIETT